MRANRLNITGTLRIFFFNFYIKIVLLNLFKNIAKFQKIPNSTIQVIVSIQRYLPKNYLKFLKY
jgi:hypothetical protein